MVPLVFQSWPIAAVETVAGAAPDLMHAMQRFVLQLAVILVAARTGGIVFRRWLRTPAVIGEIIAGVLIGPFALGSIPIFHFGPLFPCIEGALLQVSPEIYAMATLASLMLLFLSGLETDLGVFLRYFSAGTAVGIGGVVVSFFVGAACAHLFGFSEKWFSPSTLFLGAVTTATSVGITARIISEQRKTDSPEGVTILAAAVFDDVLGVAVLAVVMAMAKADHDGVSLAWGRLGVLIARTFAFWLVFTAGGLLSARRISAIMKRIGSESTIASFALGLALLLAGFVEMAGLAMIIGAYIMGLSLSRTDLALVVREQLRSAHDLFVPVFFCVMGMLIDLRVLYTVLGVGLIFALIAIATKLLGCGLPALAYGFNLHGALRIGLGMVPRGEVALIIAGTGLAAGVISPPIFGLTLVMIIISTITPPPLLIRSFAGGPGLRQTGRPVEKQQEIVLDLTHPDLADLLLRRIARLFRQEEFFVTPISEDPPVYQVRKDEMVFTLRLEDARVVLSAPARHADVARFVLLEEVLDIKNIADSLKSSATAESLSVPLAESLFRKT